MGKNGHRYIAIQNVAKIISAVEALLELASNLAVEENVAWIQLFR